MGTMQAHRLKDEDLDVVMTGLSKDGHPAKMILQFVWMFLDDGQETPLFYSYSFSPGTMQAPCLHRLGMDAQHQHQCLRKVEAARKVPYCGHMLNDPDHDFQAVFTERDFLMHDHDLHLNLQLFPYGGYFGDDTAMRVPYLVHFGAVSGTYQDKRVKGAGGFEKLALFPDSQGGICKMTVLDLAGVREDGTTESCFLTMYDDDRAAVFYQCGNKVVMSDQVSWHGEYEPLVYAGGDTVILTRAVARFCDNVIHYEAKHGFRGGTEPMDQAEDFSNTAGIWYEGDIPYGHRLNFATAELHKTTAASIRPYDF